MRPSNSAVSFLYAYYRFQEIYLSAIWAGIITMAPTFIYWWAQGKGYLPRLHALRRIEWKVMPWLFAAAFLVVLFRYVRPDWVIGRRLRRVGSSQALDLQSHANGFAIDWVWASYDDAAAMPSQALPFGMDPTSALLVNNRCWTLSSTTDPSRLLVVTHTPTATAAGVVTGRGSKTLEVVSVMYFGGSASRRAPLPPETRDRLAALGYKILQTPDGLWVKKTRANGRGKGEAAMDQVQTDEIIELWRLCSGASPGTA